jgi:hypothetical protein
MICLEENLEYNRYIRTAMLYDKLNNYLPDDIDYTCQKLSEAGFIEIKTDILGNITITNLTYNGHIFLDTIRDSGVWKETKSKISKLASVSLPILQQVAAQLINHKLGI